MQVVESIVKNCSEYLHTQVVESGVLLEMVKIGKKKVTTPHFCLDTRVHRCGSGCLTAVCCSASHRAGTSKSGTTAWG